MSVRVQTHTDIFLFKTLHKMFTPRFCAAKTVSKYYVGFQIFIQHNCITSHRLVYLLSL